MGRVAHHAATGCLPRVSGHAANTLEWRPKHGSLARAMSGTTHDSSSRAVLGPDQISCAACWAICPGPELQDYWWLVPHSKKKSIVGTQSQQVVCFACRVVPPNGAAAQAWPVGAYGSSGRVVLGPYQILRATDPFGPARNYRTTGGWCPS
jgi:hypothetical protein